MQLTHIVASATDTNTLLSVRGLRTQFELDEGTVQAVDGVDLDVRRGQVLGIVGESGSGKSVTLRSILRLTQTPGRQVAGEINYRNRQGHTVDLAKLPARSREMRSMRGRDIALIPQEPMAAFSPVHTIGAQVTDKIRLHLGLNRRQAREILVEGLREVGIPSPDQQVDSYVWQLSGGLRQRVAIAAALSCGPRLLLADEPTTALDVTTQAQIMELLRMLQTVRNLSIIFVTHDLGVIAQLADDVAVMYLGRVVEVGSVTDIFHNAKHPYTQALLRSVPTLASNQRQTKLPVIANSIPHPLARPSGCPFHPRCEDMISGKCEKEYPELPTDDQAHRAACHLL